MRWLFVLVVLAAGCAPAVDGPAEKQRATDRSDGDRVAAQLAALPGVVRSEVVLQRPVRDPLRAMPASGKPSSSVVVIVDDQVDRGAMTERAKQLVGVAMPGVEPVVVVEVGAVRPVMAKLGPFTVEAGSKGPLKAAIAIVLAVLASLSGWLAWRNRPSTRAG